MAQMVTQFEVFHPRTLCEKRQHYTNSHRTRSPFCVENFRSRDGFNIRLCQPDQNAAQLAGIFDRRCKLPRIGSPQRTRDEAHRSSVSNFSIRPMRLVLTDAFRGAGDAQRNCFICRRCPQSALFSGTSKLVGTAPLQNWGPSREPSRL